MSRIGKRPISVPDGVKVDVKGREVHVKGPKGELSQTMPGDISVAVADGSVEFKRDQESKETRSSHGLARALVANMVTGVTEGFQKALEIQGVGYRAEASGKTLKVSVGFSHPVDMAVPEGLAVKVQDAIVTIEGIDKQAVGQFAADVRSLRPPEPYKGKGIRYVGEHVRRKVGKAGAA